MIAAVNQTADQSHAPAEPTRPGSIRLKSIGKTFDNGTRAIDTVSLTIDQGDFVAFLGPSGCGKSTLLRIISGLDSPTTGTLDVGLEKNHADNANGRDVPFAYVFQDAHLLPWRRVISNVALPLELRGVSKAQRLSAAREALALVGLHDAEQRFPAQLSGGMRMRVSLARALVTNPRILLLDEPFAALDELTRQRLDEQLRELWLQKRMTVIFVTHSISEAAFLANRAVVFSARPARVMLDTRLQLPETRSVSLRSDPGFVLQTRALHEALVKGGA
jgi:NitT/TauT family transport system ATP-binding protein